MPGLSLPDASRPSAAAESSNVTDRWREEPPSRDRAERLLSGSWYTSTNSKSPITATPSAHGTPTAALNLQCTRHPDQKGTRSTKSKALPLPLPLYLCHCLAVSLHACKRGPPFSLGTNHLSITRAVAAGASVIGRGRLARARLAARGLRREATPSTARQDPVLRLPSCSAAAARHGSPARTWLALAPYTQIINQSTRTAPRPRTRCGTAGRPPEALPLSSPLSHSLLAGGRRASTFLTLSLSLYLSLGTNRRRVRRPVTSPPPSPRDGEHRLQAAVASTGRALAPAAVASRLVGPWLDRL